jgi:sigma-E factor negative regulatory protein RseC
MIEEIAVVTRVETGRLWIRRRQNGACGGCIQQSTCGTSAMAQWLPKREFAVECAVSVRVGDPVRVAIDDSHVLLGSALLYLLPLLAMLTGVGWAKALLPTVADAWLPEIALTGLLLAFWAIHHLQKRLIGRLLEPTIILDESPLKNGHTS